MDASHEEAPERSADTGYRPSATWLVVAVAGWVLSLLPTLSHGRSGAYFLGTMLGSLILPAIVRVLWVALVARGAQFWERALYSPWLWVISIALNLLAAGPNPG